MNRTKALIAVFSAAAIGIAATLPGNGFAGMSGDEDQQKEEKAGMELKDQAGNSYVLTKNSDGTETAVYEDGRSVCFVHAGVNGLSYVSGMHGLLAGLAVSYYAYRGLLGGNYHDGEENGMVPVSAQNASTGGTGGYYHTYYGKRTGSTGRVQANVPHSGFGSAGARSAAS